MSEELVKTLEHIDGLCKGPLYEEAKNIAEKMVEDMGKHAPPGTKVSNGQLVMIGAMVSAILMSNTPDGTVEEIALKMHMHFLEMLLRAIKESQKEQVLN